MSKYLGDYAEDYTDLNFKFTTQSSSGAPTTLAGSPIVSIFKSNGSTGSTGGVTLTADFGSITGLNHVNADLSSTAGPWEYDAGEDYSVVITTGTVGGNSVVGYTVADFSIENRHSIWDESTTNHTIVGTFGEQCKTDIDEILTDSADLQSNGVFARRIGTNDAAGETASQQLALSAASIVSGTVDNTAHTPTTTEFEADDITEATADHYNGRVAIFTSGALQNQVASITDYAISAGRGHFTVSTMTEAPANNDTFIIV